MGGEGPGQKAVSWAPGARSARLAGFRSWNKGQNRALGQPGRGRGGLTNDLRAVGLAALVMTLAGCASASSQEVAGRADESTPPSLESRLQALSDKYVVEERPSRDPGRIRTQIANLEARRLTLLQRYTPTHPSVLQIDRQLRILQEQLAAAEAAQATTAPPAP